MADAMGGLQQRGDSGFVWGDREFYDGGAFAIGAERRGGGSGDVRIFEGVRRGEGAGLEDGDFGPGDADGVVHVFDVHECGGLHGVSVGECVVREAGAMVGLFGGVGHCALGEAKRDCLAGVAGPGVAGVDGAEGS